MSVMQNIVSGISALFLYKLTMAGKEPTTFVLICEVVVYRFCERGVGGGNSHKLTMTTTSLLLSELAMK